MDEELEQALRRIRGEPEDDMDSALRAIRAGSVTQARRQPTAPVTSEERGTLGNLGRGVMSGLSKAGTSLIGGAGYLGEVLGAEDNVLQRFARETEQEAREFYDPQGRAGAVGQFLGQAAGGIATGVGGARLAGQALVGVAPRAAAALQGAAPLGQRVAAQAAINAPIDVLQGLSQERGMVLPGRAGAVLENVGFSALGGVLPGASAAPRARGTVPPAREGVEITGRRLQQQVERIARDTEIPANVDPQDYLNVARLSDDPVVQGRLLQATQRAVEETDIPGRRPRRPDEKLGRLEVPETFDDIRNRVAQDPGISPADVIARTQRGERIGRDDLLRVRTALRQVNAEENELIKRIQSGAFATAEEAATAQAMRQRLRDESNGLLNVISKQGTETARDLSAMRMAALESGDPAVWLGRLQTLAKRNLSDVERAAVYGAAESKDIDTLMRLGRDVQKSTTGEKLAAFFRANLLTNPKTHAINMTGNVGMRLLETAKDIPATLFDALISGATGTARTKDLSLRDLATGGFAGARKGLADAAEVLRRGDIDTRTLEIPKETNFDTPLANLYVNGVFRLMGAEDKFFRTIAFTRSMEEQARLLAKAEGLRGPALTQRVQEIVRKPSAQMEAQAMLDADIVTFRQDSGLAQAASGMRNTIAKAFGGKDVGNTVANILMPFARTPANIAQTIINYSPLGAVSPTIGRLRGTVGQKELVEALGRSSVGTLAMFAGYQMAKKGEMTGFFPTDQKTRQEWELTGRTEGSMRVGDTWVQVNRISPMGNLMTIGAALYQLEQEDVGLAEQIIRTGAMPASAVYDLPMVSGVRDIVEAIRPGGEGAEAFTRGVARAAQGFIPAASLVRGIARGTDETVRQTRTGEGASVARSFLSGIPGAAQQLPARLTALGEPIRRQGGLAQSLFTPVGISAAKTANDPAVQEIERTGAVPSPLTQRPGEDDAAFANRQRQVGTVIRRSIETIMTDPRYQAIRQADPVVLRKALAANRIDPNRLSDEQVRTRMQRLVLDRAIGSVKTEASKYFPSPYPEVVIP